MFRLEGKNVVVTGGGSGIGRAIAELFASAGAGVAIFDIDEAAATDTETAIRSAGREATWFACDVARAASVDSAFADARHRFGRIDVLVNNAGISHIGTVENTSPEDFERVLSINVKGVYHCLRAVLPHLREIGGGTILNLSSVASVTGLADRFAYSASKGAVHTMTFSVAADYLGHNIRCNCICPARVHTPFVDGYLEKNYPPEQREEMFRRLSAAQPVGRMARPEEVAQLALYLCSDASRFITGQAFPIDGGYLNLPR